MVVQLVCWSYVCWTTGLSVCLLVNGGGSLSVYRSVGLSCGLSVCGPVVQREEEWTSGRPLSGGRMDERSNGLVDEWSMVRQSVDEWSEDLVTL